MIADERRTNAYVTALQRAITPDDIVLDIGTGTGIFAMLACRFGARHVYAVEPDDSIHVARRLANENGYADQITFIQDLSTRITLPERANVMISDLHGVLPFFGFHIPSIMDARQRHLAPGAILIPQQDKLWATIVTAPEQYKEYVNPWDVNKYNLKMQAARHNVINVWGRGKIKPEDFLVSPQSLFTLDYMSIAASDFSATVSWTAEKPGTAHGLAVWFDTKVAEDICISNAPGLPELVYGHAFFPWTNPVSLCPGDEIRILLEARLIGDDYVWRWDTKVLDPNQGRTIKADFRQSTFHSTLLSPAQLSKKSSNYLAVLNDDGEVDRFILENMDGNRQLGEIADALKIKFPNLLLTGMMR
jgi:type I protein arginine methyltransferase